MPLPPPQNLQLPLTGGRGSTPGSTPGYVSGPRMPPPASLQEGSRQVKGGGDVRGRRGGAVRPPGEASAGVSLPEPRGGRLPAQRL